MKIQILLVMVGILIWGIWPGLRPWSSLSAANEDAPWENVSELAHQVDELSEQLEFLANQRAEEEENEEARVDEGENTPAQGRLTTESGVPVSTADRTSQGTLYYTPYQGSRISVWNGSKWLFHKFTERSLALTATSGKNYDVFIYDNTGTLTLELSAAWTTDVARADALATRNGVLVKSSDHTRRYLGSVRASGANVVADAMATRYVWNYYNRVFRLIKTLATTTYFCNAAWGVPSSTTKGEVITGVNESLVHAQGGGMALGATNIGFGIGLDTTGVNTAALRGAYSSPAPGVFLITDYREFPGLGYHSVNLIEKCGNWSTVYVNYSNYLFSNLVAFIEG